MLMRDYSRLESKYSECMEDRIGQVWTSRWWEDKDLANATVFVITSRDRDWTNPHTGRVTTSWVGHVLSNPENEIGRKYVWQEDNLLSGGDSYDNVYERIL